MPHRSLQIPELVYEIATKLLPPCDVGHYGDSRFPEIKNGRKDVLSLALTSKAFLEQSLDILWRDLDSMYPILHVLDVIPTRDIWPGHRGSSASRVYRSVNAMKELGLLAEAHWDRLDYYGPRIRSLLVTQYHPPVYRTLLRYRQKTSGFAVTPNLRSLIWRVHDEEHFGFLPFCGPSLTSLTIKPPNLDISTLELAVKSTSHHLSPEAFVHIATMPHLETLTLTTLPPEWFPPISPGNPASTPFLPAVKNLRLSHSRLDTIARFLPAIDNVRQLERIQIEFAEEDQKTTIGSFIATVGKFCSVALVAFFLSLKRIHPDIEDRSIDVFRFTQAIFSPLLAFKNMEQCDIRVHVLDVDDAFLESVAASWPNLRSFSLIPIEKYKDESRLTLPGLLPLAKNCPHLYNVKLNLNTRITADDLSAGLDRMVRTWDHAAVVGTLPDLHLWLGGLRSLARGRQSEVAEHLKAIFPNTRSISDATIEYSMDR
ncbi:hypothetical protein EVG20_g9340 [Dentipellis fragilis]|uniref:F-box domain-containing protein n=1 Tax=Dentipellis fragilis TaxID=205917 RepID=A0A4Y9Y0X1_9AGAM|nr:hypothetical protein EVG20_g9340 [Dentipellis fragilis]